MPRTPTARQIQTTAIHEAGHVVLAWRAGLKVRTVSVVPEGDALGFTAHYGKPSFWRSLDAGSARRDIAEDYVMMGLGGVVAERIATGRASHLGARSDYRKAVDILSALSSEDPKECQAWIKLLLIRAERMLRNHRSAVNAIADALRERGTLTGEECKRLALAAR